MVITKSQGKQYRLTVTLGPGQREVLERIAKRNHATLAFLVRYALDRLIEDYGQQQMRLELKDIS